LSAPYWTQLTGMRVPNGRGRIDRVVVGPSGVHVVIERPALPHPSSTVGEDDPALAEAAQSAVVAAAAVADLLPPRYRHLVTSEVSLVGLTEAAIDAGVVLAATPDVLRHVWRHRPRVVSTSEAAVIVGQLRDRLEPYPAEPTVRRESWWRRWPRRPVVAGAASVVVASTVAAAVAVGIPPL